MTNFERVTPRLPVTDLRATVAFYRDRLGFHPDVVWPEEEPTFAILDRDGISVGFFAVDEARGQSIGYAELYIEVSDAAALHAALIPEVEVEWGPEVYAYGRREFAIRDPDGYLIAFTEPTEDAPTTDEPG